MAGENTFLSYTHVIAIKIHQGAGSSINAEIPAAEENQCQMGHMHRMPSMKSETSHKKFTENKLVCVEL